MHFTIQAVIAFFAFASTFVQSAPTALDVATLLKNGQAAQKLNAQFQTIKLSDACGGTGLTTACVGNAISNCVNDAWDSTNGACSKSQQCFAIPNVQSDGTILSCTSEKSALSIINATGAKGGIAGADASSSTDGTTPPTSSDPSNSSTSVAQPSGATPAPTPTVTVTVTVAPAATTLPATILTLSPQDASSALSSILAQGTPTPSSASSASVTSIDSASSPTTTSLPPSTIILLTAAPETSAPASSSVSAAVASISGSSDVSGGSGYGGY